MTVASDDGVFCCRAISILPLGTERALVTTLADRNQVIVSAHVAALARCFQSFSSLEAVAQLTSDRDATLSILQGMVAGGLLVSKQRFVALLREHDRTPERLPLRIIGMPTCNRIDAMQRGIESYMANASRHGHTIEVVITDDARDPAIQQGTRDAVSLVAQRHGHSVRYAGPAEKTAFVARLATASGVNADTIHFALFGVPNLGATYGGNRNALYLANAGERFFSADDDTTSDLVVPDDAEAGLAFSSDSDPTKVRLHRVDEDLKGRREDMDLLGIHAQVLGRGIADVMPEPPGNIGFSQCATPLMTLLEQGTGRIRMSWTGIAGDSGAKYPQYYLHRPQTDRSGMQTDADYLNYCRSRTILRAPQCLTIGSGTYCQTTALAFDGTTLLPPFFPVQRGEDILFGTMLRVMSPSSLSAYHPFAISHRPIEQRGAATGQSQSSTEDTRKDLSRPSFYNFMMSFIGSFVPPIGTNDETTRLAALGRHFITLGSLSASDFVGLVWDNFNTSTSQTIAYFEQQLKEQSNAPPAYLAYYQDMITDLLSKLSNGSEGDATCILPSDLFVHRTPEEGRNLAQQLLMDYGRLCVAWPLIVAASRQLNGAGRGLAIPV